MNRNHVRRRQNAQQPVPNKNELRRHKNRRKGKRADNKSRANIAARVKTQQKARRTGLQEYNAEELSEALIWSRDFKPDNSGERPLIGIDTPEPEIEPPRQVKNKKLRHKPTTEKKNAGLPAVSTRIEHIDVATPPPESKLPRQRADHEPEQRRERTYFWNQADVYQPNDRDVLPEIAEQKGKAEEEETINTEKPELVETPLPLERAVNPNLPLRSSSYEADSEERTPQQQKPGFMARRHQKRAVQSQHMEGETFEQPAQPLPFAESTAEPADEFEAPKTEQLEPPVRYETTERSHAEALPDETSRPEAAAESSDKPSEFEAMITAEKELGKKPEIPAETVEFSLDKSEQLDLAKNIQLDGVSVLEMYQAKRIDEAGLRRIIIEFLRGGDLRHVIKNEIIRLQLRFERDPQLRDKPVNDDFGPAPNIPDVGLRQRTKALLDVSRNRDKTERLAEITQSALEKSHDILGNNPKTGRYLSIVAIIVIYLLILIAAIAK